MSARGEFGLPEPGTVPELAQLAQESRRVVSRHCATRHLPYIGLTVLHPGTPPLNPCDRPDP
jgi:hypothetical protein